MASLLNFPDYIFYVSRFPSECCKSRLYHTL